MWALRGADTTDGWARPYLRPDETREQDIALYSYILEQQQAAYAQRYVYDAKVELEKTSFSTLHIW